MDKLKRIAIEVTFFVGYEDVDLPENVKAELIQIAESGQTLKSESPKYPAALEWLNQNIKERDSMAHQYEIYEIIQ